MGGVVRRLGAGAGAVVVENLLFLHRQEELLISMLWKNGVSRCTREQSYIAGCLWSSPEIPAPRNVTAALLTKAEAGVQLRRHQNKVAGRVRGPQNGLIIREGTSCRKCCCQGRVSFPLFGQRRIPFFFRPLFQTTDSMRCSSLSSASDWPRHPNSEMLTC